MREGRWNGAKRYRLCFGQPRRVEAKPNQNRIKEQPLGLFGNRTSAHGGWANQLRVLWSAAASVLMETLRRVALEGTELARAQVGTIRLRLLRIGTGIVRNPRRIRLLLSSAYPYQGLFAQVAQVQRTGVLTRHCPGAVRTDGGWGHCAPDPRWHLPEHPKTPSDPPPSTTTLKRHRKTRKPKNGEILRASPQSLGRISSRMADAPVCRGRSPNGGISPFDSLRPRRVRINCLSPALAPIDPSNDLFGFLPERATRGLFSHCLPQFVGAFGTRFAVRE